MTDRYIPACHSDACNQGRKSCPCPSACQVSEESGESTKGLLVSPAFWIGGAVSLALCVGVWFFCFGGR